jgi:outer membrane protein assembly factor BamB
MDESGILSLTGANGHARWTVLLGDASGPPALDDAGRCYVATRDGQIFSVDGLGRIRWIKILEAEPTGGVTVGAGWVALALGDGAVQWLSAKDGHQIASVVTGERPSSAPVLLHDRALIVPTVEGAVVKLDARGIIWRTAVATRAPIGALAIGAQGELYASNADGWITRIALDGTPAWQVAAHASFDRSPIVGEDGTVYAAADEELLALDAGTGERRWAASAGGRIVGGPLIANDRTLYVTVVSRGPRKKQGEGALLGAAVAISETGAVISTMALPSPPISGLTLSGHSLSTGLVDGTVQRVRVRSEELASRSPWPKARGGPRNGGHAATDRGRGP